MLALNDTVGRAMWAGEGWGGGTGRPGSTGGRMRKGDDQCRAKRGWEQRAVSTGGKKKGNGVNCPTGAAGLGRGGITSDGSETAGKGPFA